MMVDVVTVPHCFVVAAVNVPVGRLVGPTGMTWRACIGVHRRDGHAMLVNVSLILPVQVAVVQIVGVAFMQHGGMAAVGTVLVILILVGMMMDVCLGHDFLLVSSIGGRRQPTRRRASDRPDDACEPHRWSRLFTGAQVVPTPRPTYKSFILNTLNDFQAKRSGTDCDAESGGRRAIMSQVRETDPLIRAIHGETDATQTVTESICDAVSFCSSNSASR